LRQPIVGPVRSAYRSCVNLTNNITELDNIFSIKQWATNKFPGIDSTQFNKNFGISEEFDYVTAPKF